MINYVIPVLLGICLLLISFKMLTEYSLRKRNKQLKKWFDENR